MTNNSITENLILRSVTAVARTHGDLAVATHGKNGSDEVRRFQNNYIDWAQKVGIYGKAGGQT